MLNRRIAQGFASLTAATFFLFAANHATADDCGIVEEGTISLSIVKELGEDQKPSDLLGSFKKQLEKIAKDNDIELINRSSIDMSISRNSYARRDIIEVYLNAYLYFKDNPKAADVYYAAIEPNSFSYSSSRYEETAGCESDS